MDISGSEWFALLGLGTLFSLISFFLARSSLVSASLGARRLLFAAAGIVAVLTAAGCGITGILMAGYCEDFSTSTSACGSGWWQSAGVGLLIVALPLLYLGYKSARRFDAKEV